MTTEVVMPQLGESVVEGTIGKWLKREGDLIEEFEPLLEVITDKVDTEIPSPASGKILKLYASEGQTVDAGALLAVIGEPDESPPESPRLSHEASGAIPTPTTERLEAQKSTTPEGRAKGLGFISPVVARIAGEQDIDLTRVEGTGRNGRITKKDVLAYIDVREKRSMLKPAPWEQPGSGELFRPTEEVFGTTASTPIVIPDPTYDPGNVVPHNTVRRTIAEHMVRSKRTSPHVTTVMEVDLSRVIAHRQTHKDDYQSEGVNLTYTAYFTAAAIDTLKAIPIVNSSWVDEGMVLHSGVNIGIAVSLGEQGLIVPVIKDADKLSLRGLAWAVDDLASRARSRKLKPDEVREGTFTITNHGVGRSIFATPIINQPQSAILGVGAIQKRVVVVEGSSPLGDLHEAIAIRPIVYLSLTFDHRILDGAIADSFLGKIVDRLRDWS